jgi:multimeric flavodoxin WrbA
MQILAIIASSRQFGNTELLVTEIGKAAVRERADVTVSLLRLTDLRLGYCTGCMQCAFEDGGACPLEDDMEFLLSEYERADALIFGAPAYTLLPPGPVKLVADRLIMQLGRSAFDIQKPAVTVGVAGLPRWSEMLVPLLNCTVLGQGFHLVDSFLAFASGPGAVLLDPENVTRARDAGTRLGRALAGENLRCAFGPGHCPVCGADFFRLTAEGIECPLCLAPGSLVENQPVFAVAPANRWEPQALKRHFVEWIQASGSTYLDQRPEIRKLAREYRDRPFPMIKPA